MTTMELFPRSVGPTARFDLSRQGTEGYAMPDSSYRSRLPLMEGVHGRPMSDNIQERQCITTLLLEQYVLIVLRRV